jgi:phage/plasmid-associated DNA primase
LYTAVLLWSEQEGAGKSLLGEVIGSLYGDNYYELAGKELASEFNEWADRRQFILINEVVSTGRREDADKLKVLITREHATVNRKYQPTYVIRDCSNYFLTSNHPNAVYMEDTDRRFFVLHVTGRLDENFGDRVGEWKKTEKGRAALLNHLQHVNLMGFWRAPRKSSRIV